MRFFRNAKKRFFNGFYGCHYERIEAGIHAFKSDGFFAKLINAIDDWFTTGGEVQAAATAGVNVTRYRYVSVILCGMLCGLAGAYLSVDQSNLFVKEMVAGRGFMALAATIFGGWNPAGSLLASLLFAFAQALRINVSMALPQRILQMVPYVLTLLVLIVFRRRAQGPQAAGDIKD